MTWDISITPSNGHVRCGTFEVSPQTTPDHLSSDFSVGEERLVQVLGKQVPCIQATTRGRKGALDFEVSLRFETRVLVKVFIAISDPSVPNETFDEFYASREPLLRVHRDWLQAQLGDIGPNLTAYPWGSVGVARDKSDGIYVVLVWSGER